MKTLFPAGRTKTEATFVDGSPVNDGKAQRIQDEIEDSVNELVGCLGENGAQIFFMQNTSKETPATVLVLTREASEKFGASIGEVVTALEALLRG